MEPFAEKPIDHLASTSICTELVRGEWRYVWGALHKFNSIRHGREQCRNCYGRETAEMAHTNPGTQIIICNAVTLALRYAKVNENCRMI